MMANPAYGFQATAQAERAQIVAYLRSMAENARQEAATAASETARGYWVCTALGHDVAADVIEQGCHFYTPVPAILAEAA